MLILILILNLLSWHQGSVAVKSDRNLAHLKGDVSYVSVQQAAVTNEEGKAGEGRRESVSVTTYDAAGWMKESTYNPNAHSAVKREFTYDAEGKRIEKFARYKIAGENDEKEELIAQPRVFKTAFKYDADGNRIEEDKYTESGGLVEKWLYNYDRGNHTVEVIVFGAGDAFLSRCVESYDSKERAAERTCYNAQGGILARETYAYENHDVDDRGNWTKRVESLWQMNDGRLANIGRVIAYRSIRYFSPGQPISKNETANSTPPPSSAASNKTPIIPANSSEDLIAAKAVKRVEPVYPPFARNLNVSGVVVVELTIDDKGRVVKAEAVSGPGPLKQAAVDAAKKWEFQPATQNGKPVQNVSRITFNFIR